MNDKSKKLVNLFEPINIGPLRLKNRLVMAPMGTSFATDQGVVTSRQLAYYAERARGGVAMITTECTTVSATGRTIYRQLGAYDDSLIPGLAQLAHTIKECDCRAILQLHHSGSRAEARLNRDVHPKGPSPIAPFAGEVPGELTTSEIEFLIEDFASAAIRAKQAGFDGVELHGAHGYLIAQFLSPNTNKRTDDYGGNLENRTRFALEVIARIKAKVGSDYPIIFKLSADEYLPEGLKLEEATGIASALEHGGINAIIASAGDPGQGGYDGFARSVPGEYAPRGCYVHLAQALKKAVRIPVGAVGRINDPILASNILTQGKADLIYMGRALLADPELPRKSQLGQVDKVRFCLACNYCEKMLHSDSPDLRCAVNPALGREEGWEIIPTNNPKKVLVVGAGPAGMQAASIAALRGHKVLLYEKERQVGGKLLLAQVAPHKGEINELIRYLRTQINNSSIALELGKEVSLDTIKELRPDVVVLATGSLPSLGEDLGGRDIAFMAEDVLSGKSKPLHEPTIVVGGGMVGCETAELLASKGFKEITIIKKGIIAEGLEEVTRLQLIKRLKQYGVTLLTGHRVKKIKGGSVILENGDELAANTIIFAMGRKPNHKLSESSIRAFVPEVFNIGDCAQPRMIADAIAEGANVGRMV